MQNPHRNGGGNSGTSFCEATSAIHLATVYILFQQNIFLLQDTDGIFSFMTMLWLVAVSVAVKC